MIAFKENLKLLGYIGQKWVFEILFIYLFLENCRNIKKGQHRACGM